MLMGKQSGLLALQAFKESDGGFDRTEASAHGSGGDEQAEDAFDARDEGLASGADLAVDDVVLVGEAGQENAPGALQNDGQGEAVVASESFEFGRELGGEMLFALGLLQRSVFRDGCAEARGRVDS